MSGTVDVARIRIPSAASLRDGAAVGLVGFALLAVLAATPLGLPGYAVNIVGQVATFALLALSLDLVWGYCGLLSLGHGLFFALGGYLAGMHLLVHARSVTGVLPDLLQFMGLTDFPAYWWGFGSFAFTVAAVLALPTLLAAGVGLVAARSRISGVYFAILTQALTYTAMLLMFRNDTGFGGNNGMTGFSHLLGVSIADPWVGRGLAAASLAVLLAALLGGQFFFRTRTGRTVIAARDDEQRLRMLGYDTRRLRAAVFAASGLLAGLAGALYVPQVGIINPRLLSPELSLEVAVWVAVGGRGTLSGAVFGAVLINGLKFWLGAAAPQLWPFILAGTVLLLVLTLPDGLSFAKRTR